MNKFKVKIKPFKSKNAGGVAHNQLHQPEAQRQKMLDMSELLIQLYNKLTSTHHKKPLPAVGLDGERTQVWHIKKLSSNTSGRRANINHLIYEADVLRHNAVLKDIINQLGAKGNTPEALASIMDELYIELDEDKPFNSSDSFNRLF
jgi:hypothetical protein